MTEQRCPFCHEPCAPDDPQRVSCASCDAGHHAACFAEGRGCAATACRAVTARIGTKLVTIEQLLAAAEDPAALARLDDTPAYARVDWTFLALAVAIVVTSQLMLWVSGHPPGRFDNPFTALALLVGAVLTFLAFRPPGQGGRPRVVVRDEPRAEFDPIFGVVSPTGWVPGVLPDQGQAVLDRLAKAPPVAPATVPAPERCPSCGQTLREPGEEPELLAFCFHCGASLGPESDPEPPGPEKELPEKAPPGKSPVRDGP